MPVATTPQPTSATALLAQGSRPLYAQLRDLLKTRILEGKLPPAAKLPSESELTTQYGVSRITVRQALTDLHQEGLIIKVHGKGTFVSQPVVAQDLTQLRGLAESLAGENRSIHTRLLSHKTVKAPEHVATCLQVGTRTPVSELRTVRYLNRVPLSLNHSYMSVELGERLRKTDLANRDILHIYENDLGLVIGHADLTISALTASDSHAKHLDVPAGTALLQVERMLFDADEQPLQLEQSSYRSDLFSYRLSVERRRM